MYAIKFRNEDGNWYRSCEGSMSFWSSYRGDAWLYVNRAYAEKMATMLDNQMRGNDEIRSRVHVVQMVLK